MERDRILHTSHGTLYTHKVKDRKNMSTGVMLKVRWELWCKGGGGGGGGDGRKKKKKEKKIFV